MSGMDLGAELRLVIERTVRRYLGSMVSRLAYGVVLVALIPVVVILSIVVFGALAVVVFGLYALLGEPQLLAPIVGLGWFVGALLVIFLLLLRGHRWLTRLLALADAPAKAVNPYGDEPTIAAVERGPSPISSSASTFQERIAAADARHAQTPPEPPRQDRSG
jgi:hypothetical protein